MLLRFVQGRPVSQVTEDFLAWACERLAAEGKRALLLIWDNASWHVSRRVRSWIKEQQLDLFAGRTSCHRSLANRFRRLLSAAAYVLVQALRRTALAGTGRARAQVGTIRLRLLKVAARVVISARRVVFHLASSYRLQETFRSILEGITSRAVPGRAGVG